MIVNKKIEYGTSPLFCWDVFACDTHELRTTLKKSQDVQELKFLAEKKGWEFEWERLFDFSYQTIVLTGVDNRIMWVGDGFHEMTGYPKVYALGKSPQFLQGPGTSEEDKESFKEKLLGGGEFTQRILNYRKDRSEYICEVTVLPIMGLDQSPAAFLALESEVF